MATPYAVPAPDDAPVNRAYAVPAPDDAPSDGYTPTQYGFKVRPIGIGNGKQSVQREDGAVYFGPDQGNKGKPGWFDGHGNRMGEAPGKSPSLNDMAANQLANENRKLDRLPFLGRIVPPQISGAAKGLADVVMAPAQVIAHAFGSNVMDQPVDDLQRYYENNWSTSKGGEMLGQALPFVATMGGSSAAQAPGVLSGIARAAGTGAVAAPMMTPETNVKSNSDFWVRKGQESITGGVTGGTLASLGAGVGALSSKLKAPMAPEAQAIQDLGDRFGVRTLAPDLATNRPGLAKAAVMAESVPGSGMVAQRTAQQAEARAAAEKLLAQHGIEGEVPATIQKSLQSNLASVKGKVRGAYDAVGQAAEGLGAVPMDGTMGKIQAALKSEESAVVPDQGLIGILKKMSDRIESGNVDTSYTGVRGLRSDLGSMISDYYKGTNATTGSKGVQVLQGVKGAVEQDLSAFTDKAGGEVAKAARRADNLYKNELVPLKDQVIVKATKNSEPDQIFKAIVGAGQDRAQKFYGALDPSGQAAVRSQMVQNAMDSATAVDGVFSPAKFAQSLEKIKDSTGVFFKGQDKFELDGFTNLMRHIQRAGQINENPSNGQRMLQYLTLGEIPASMTAAAMGHPAALAAPVVSAGSARAVTKMFASAAGKRFLLSASTATPGTAAMDSLITKQLPAFLAAESPKNVTPLRPTMPLAADNGTTDQLAQK